MLEANTLAACIPGAEEVKAVDEQTYDCLVNQKIGPIILKLKFRVIIVEKKPPTFIKAVGNSVDILKSGGFRMDMTINLAETSNDVEITFLTNVDRAGKFANFGERIMRAKANQLNKDFINAMELKLQERMTRRS